MSEEQPTARLAREGDSLQFSFPVDTLSWTHDGARVEVVGKFDPRAMDWLDKAMRGANVLRIEGVGEDRPGYVIVSYRQETAGPLTESLIIDLKRLRKSKPPQATLEADPEPNPLALIGQTDAAYLKLLERMKTEHDAADVLRYAEAACKLSEARGHIGHAEEAIAGIKGGE